MIFSKWISGPSSNESNASPIVDVNQWSPAALFVSRWTSFHLFHIFWSPLFCIFATVAKIRNFSAGLYSWAQSAHLQCSRIQVTSALQWRWTTHRSFSYSHFSFTSTWLKPALSEKSRAGSCSPDIIWHSWSCYSHSIFGLSITSHSRCSRSLSFTSSENTESTSSFREVWSSRSWSFAYQWFSYWWIKTNAFAISSGSHTVTLCGTSVQHSVLTSSENGILSNTKKSRNSGVMSKRYGVKTLAWRSIQIC